MASILETETSNLGYNGIKTEISRHSRNVNKGLQTNSDDSKKEIKNNTLSSLANIGELPIDFLSEKELQEREELEKKNNLEKKNLETNNQHSYK